MRSKTVSFVSVLVLVGWLVFAASLNAQPSRYRVVNLGNLTGSVGSGNSLNDIGWAEGFATLADNTIEHATVWVYGLKSDLGTLGGPNSDVQWPNKNTHGLVSGWSETSAMNPYDESWSCTAFNPTGIPTGHVCVGFRWQWGEMTALPTLGGYNGFAAGNNDRGEIVGWAETNYHDPTCAKQAHNQQVLQFLPVVWGPGENDMRKLPTYPGDPDGAATAANSEGDVVGISGTCYVAVGALSAKHALLWRRDGDLVNLGSLGGYGWNTPMAVNRGGDVVGFSDLPGDYVNGVLTANFHAFLWSRELGRMTDLGVLPGDTLSEALDINDRGQIVGISLPSFRAFLYEHGKMWDLNGLISGNPGLFLIEGGGINNRGEITGQACVIADGGCPLGSDTPAYLAIPEQREEERDLDAQATNDSASVNNSIVLSDAVRQQILRRLNFGHYAPEVVQPQAR